LAALRDFEQRARESVDLLELGGDFLDHARHAGWITADGHCLLDESERRVVFSLRWVELLGKRAELPFSPTLDEWRVYYRLLLRQPDAAAGADFDSLRVNYATALERKDPSYPADLARGVALYHGGELALAASAFRRHLATHAGGPYALLARNYLIYTLEHGGIE
jgi:hypothetical protein